MIDRFTQKAREAMLGIYERGRIPIVVGGTGFYIQALLYDIDFTENGEDKSFRHELEELAKTPEGAGRLHQRLKEVDPVSAEMIHANNTKRVIRALEFFEETGTRISDHNEQQRQKESPYRFCYFVLEDERSLLYERIDRRVDEMISQGLVQEVEKLRSQGCDRSMVSMQGLGYKEILGFLEGEYDLERAVYLIKRDTRHFAKRQLTWFRREKDVIWVEKPDFASEEDMLSFMLESCVQRGLVE